MYVRTEFKFEPVTLVNSSSLRICLTWKAYVIKYVHERKNQGTCCVCHKQWVSTFPVSKSVHYKLLKRKMEKIEIKKLNCKMFLVIYVPYTIA